MNKIAPGSQNLLFDRGIESIVYARDQGDMSLPERAHAAVPEEGVRAQLAELLELPSLDDKIELAIRPRDIDRNLLVPVKFRSALDATLQRLKDAAPSAAPGQDNPEGTENLRTLNRAIRLLSEEANLRDLLQMYRSALYQG
ncbi:hypothetical protein SDC9_64578 [bioreactor metagenome]|uniref:Uncharacterized protein n=1 Tax=bioreactor metagenome TaxID=1076179 RepID=A0A644XPN8_9ZZZZ